MTFEMLLYFLCCVMLIANCMTEICGNKLFGNNILYAGGRNRSCKIGSKSIKSLIFVYWMAFVHTHTHIALWGNQKYAVICGKIVL
jgi:hypothetical protein